MSEIKVGDTVYDRKNEKKEGVVVHIQESNVTAWLLPDEYHADAEAMKKEQAEGFVMEEITTAEELHEEPDYELPDENHYERVEKVVATRGEVTVRFPNPNPYQPEIDEVYISVNYLVKKEADCI